MTVGPACVPLRDPAIGAQAALAIARHLSALAEGMDAAAAVFPGASTGWKGTTAAVVADLLATKPERFRAVAAACGSAAAALNRHADDLGPAIAIHRQAAQFSAQLGAEFDRRAAELVDDSARSAAGTLLSLARSAPPREGWRQRWVGRLESWRGEVLLGAAESSERLLNVVAQVTVRATHPYNPSNLADLWSVESPLLERGQHPVELAKELIDWDTWRRNPARAVGHLTPDLLSTLAGGGAAVSARTAESTRRGQAAIAAALARDRLRRESAAATGAAARHELVAEALTTAQRVAGTWRGAGGTRLTAGQNAEAEAFHALHSAQEPAITATLHEISQTADAELAGLSHRVKEVESFKRKLATAHAHTGQPLPQLLAEAQDAIRYTVVIADTGYVPGVGQVAGLLEQRGLVNLPPTNNAWHSGRYRGINSTWLNPDTGAVFELQFHTPASWWATVRTHRMYEEWRLPETSPERKAHLGEQIAEAYRKAPPPAGVESLTGANLLPTSPPDPIRPPVGYTVHATVTSGLGVGLLTQGADDSGGR